MRISNRFNSDRYIQCVGGDLQVLAPGPSERITEAEKRAFLIDAYSKGPPSSETTMKGVIHGATPHQYVDYADSKYDNKYKQFRGVLITLTAATGTGIAGTAYSIYGVSSRNAAGPPFFFAVVVPRLSARRCHILALPLTFSCGTPVFSPYRIGSTPAVAGVPSDGIIIQSEGSPDAITQLDVSAQLLEPGVTPLPFMEVFDA